MPPFGSFSHDFFSRFYMEILDFLLSLRSLFHLLYYLLLFMIFVWKLPSIQIPVNLNFICLHGFVTSRMYYLIAIAFHYLLYKPYWWLEACLFVLPDFIAVQLLWLLGFLFFSFCFLFHVCSVVVFHGLMSFVHLIFEQHSMLVWRSIEQAFVEV